MGNNNAELIKEAALEVCAAAGKATSCSTCNNNYCCVGQKDIEISDREWNEHLEDLITPSQIFRAIKEIKWMENEDNVEKTFDCPFNDPRTGRCEIYEDRFFVCAQYHVFNPKEDCDSRTEKGLEVLNPMGVISNLSRKPKYAGVLREMATLAEGTPTNMIHRWKRYLDDKGML